MNFSDAAKMEANKTYTENGATALKSTSNACVDFFGTIGALRDSDEQRIQRLFADAYQEVPLLAAKIVFYGRDIREGTGERDVFRTLIRYMAVQHPEALINNLDLIGVYGRYDDMYALIGTPMEDAMWAAMKKQFEEDVVNMKHGNAVSLLAKWIKTADASSRNTRRIGILTAEKLGYSVYDFKRLVRALRKHIGIIEALMSANRWDEIQYSSVPSRAMTLYRKAFMKHDGERFGNFVNKAVNGEATIHSDTLYPYDIVGKVFSFDYWNGSVKEDAVAEAQWRQLPDYVAKGTNAIVMADTSGSMYGRPMLTSLGLAIYFAERNVGAYHNLWMTFSNHPEMQQLRGETLAQKISNMDMDSWGMNTNLEAAFNLVLKIALENDVPANEMPASIIVISDMEIDACSSKDWSFYDAMRSRFEAAGYQIPNIIFWNVNSRHDVFHADASRKGVQLCSGQSVTMFKELTGCINMTPVEFMHKVMDSPRYEAITIG